VPGGSGAAISSILNSSGMSGTVLRAVSDTSAFDRLAGNTGLSDLARSLPGKELAGTVQRGQVAPTRGFQGDVFLQGMKTLGLNIAGAWAGGKVGNAIGESIFDKQAESNIGQTIGSTIGAIWGPWGAAIGSALGSMVDVASGGDGYVRQ